MAQFQKKTQTFHQLKTFGEEEDQGLLSGQKSTSDKNETTFFSQRSNNWSPQIPDVYRIIIKMLQTDICGPVPICLRYVAAIKFKMS